MSDIQGLRLLVAEDETLVSILLEDMLAELGCTLVGAAANVGKAMELLRSDAAIDAALLDVNLGGEPIDPVADELAARGVPFMFITGYGASGVRGRFAGAPVLQKPFQLPMLEQALADLAALRSR